MYQVRREVDLGFVTVFFSTFPFPTHSQVVMSLIVLMSRDNAVYDALSFQLDVTVSDSGFVYRGGFLHDALAGYLHNRSLFIHDFDYFVRCADDLIWSREFWSKFVSDNFSPHPDALACEICNLVFEDLSICVALVPVAK
jgi:hypothetical protein